jgi:hypothetical protein
MDETHVCVLDREGEVVHESKTASTAQPTPSATVRCRAPRPFWRQSKLMGLATLALIALPVGPATELVNHGDLFRKVFYENSLQSSRNLVIVTHRWRKGAHERARQKAPASASHGETEGISSKTGVVRYSYRHEGLAPVRLSKGSSRIGLFSGRILAGHRIDWPVFFRRSSVLVPGFMPRGSPGDQWTARIPFSRNQARGRQVGASGVQASRDRNGASPSLG